jgi:hypothetical protein
VSRQVHGQRVGRTHRATSQRILAREGVRQDLELNFTGRRLLEGKVRHPALDRHRVGTGAQPESHPGHGENLTGVAATSARNAWVAGYAGGGGQALIARWNGVSWMT